MPSARGKYRRKGSERKQQPYPGAGVESACIDGMEREPLPHPQPSPFHPVTLRETFGHAPQAPHVSPSASPLAAGVDTNRSPKYAAQQPYGPYLEQISPTSRYTPVSAAASATASRVSEEPSWIDIFETFLQNRSGQKREIDKACITYLGESFPLTTVLDGLRRDGGRLQLHHPGPAQISSSGTPADDREHSTSHISPKDLTFLVSRDAFKLPVRACFDGLMKTFVEKVYPLYPALNLQDFTRQWENNSLPWLLCHAICFVSANYCELHILHSAGFETRRSALLEFYGKTKLLFDFGYEKDKLVLLQSATFLTFWPSSPTDVWTFYHWISFAVTLAESMGSHRSMKHLNMARKDRSLLKRLWWILVVRDAFGAALFGRPVRINGRNCDVEHVTEEDFAPDFESTPTNPPTTCSMTAAYLAQLSQLAIILRDIILDGLRSTHASVDYAVARATCQLMLDDWRSQVPPELNWDVTGTPKNVFAATLSILYDANLIFMIMQKPACATTAVSPKRPSSMSGRGRPIDLPPITHEVAGRIIDLTGNLSTRKLLTSMPHEVFTGVFVAEVVSYTKVSSMETTVAKLARSQISCCQMIFHDVRDFWDPALWIMQLFDVLLAKGADAPDIIQQQEEMQPFTLDFLNLELLNDWNMYLGDVDNLHGDP